MHPSRLGQGSRPTHISSFPWHSFKKLNRINTHVPDCAGSGTPPTPGWADGKAPLVAEVLREGVAEGLEPGPASASSLLGGGTLGKCFPLSVPQFPHEKK